MTARRRLAVAASGLAAETSALWRYEPVADRWTRMPPAPTAPTARGALVVAVVNGRLYVAGGARDGTALRTLEIFDFARERWSRRPSMRTAREHLAGTVHRGAFYVLAGRAAGRGNFRVAERYIPARRRWERLPSMRKARGGLGAVSHRGEIVVLEGGPTPGLSYSDATEALRIDG